MFTVKRNPNNPLLTPDSEHAWEARGTFNGCPVVRGKTTYLLYRSLGLPDPLSAPSGLSTVNIAVSENGEKFAKRRTFIAPSEPWDAYGCEDPRVTYFEGQYVTFYTALGGYPFGAGNIKVAAALSKDLKTVDEKHLVTPFNAKAMALFPERVNDKVTAVLTVHTDEPPVKIAVVQVDQLEDLWDPEYWKHWHDKLPEHVVNPLRRDRDHVEVGAPPIKTKDGWLLIYSYIQNYHGGGQRVFGIEAVLLDLKDPRAIVGRTKGPILVPEELYEMYGVTDNLVFPSGALLHKEDDRLEVFYGAADSVCASFSLNLPDLLDAMIPERRAKISARAPKNPIIIPDKEHAWEKKAVFNPGVVDIGGTTHLLYRAMGDDNTSVFGYAEMSKDGLSVKRKLPEPVYVPREDFEKKLGSPDGNSGCEDPRITKIGKTLYVGYTAYNGVQQPRAALTSISVADFSAKRFDTWKKPELVTPDPIDDKDMCVLPAKIDGHYYIFHRVAGRICADMRDSLDFSKGRVTRCIDLLGPRPGMWDSEKVGIAGTPILTKKGWLFIYHGISDTKTYRLGMILLDAKDPTHVISRASDPILEPITPYEREGLVPNVVFSCGASVKKDKLIVYYGGADLVTGAAVFSISRLLDILVPPCLEKWGGHSREKRPRRVRRSRR